MVLSPDPASLTDSYALIKILSRDHNRKNFHLVINIANSDGEGLKTYQTLEKVAKKFLNLDIQYLGTVPNDKSVHKAVRGRYPFIQKAPQSKASLALFDLADRIKTLKEMTP
jgi:flagellar biosynthesis protein FlhG